jgi:hypothetical protein
MGNKSVHKLSSAVENTSVIIGIASHENDYRISWALNSNLGFHFIKTDNYQTFHKRFNEMQEFSMYISEEDEGSLILKLIANRCDNGFLVEDLRTIDYFFIIENSDISNDGSGFVQQLKSIPFISTAFIINPASVKGLSRIK